MKLQCEMRNDCQAKVTHLDERGYIYCQSHGEIRKRSMRCRKLKPSELKRLQGKETISQYEEQNDDYNRMVGESLGLR